MTNWDLFQVSKTESTFKNKFTSHQQTKEEKSHDHSNIYRKSILQNPSPIHDKKTLSKLRIERSFP